MRTGEEEKSASMMQTEENAADNESMTGGDMEGGEEGAVQEEAPPEKAPGKSG